jgi:hypothetical protein
MSKLGSHLPQLSKVLRPGTAIGRDPVTEGVAVDCPVSTFFATSSWSGSLPGEESPTPHPRWRGVPVIPDDAPGLKGPGAPSPTGRAMLRDFLRQPSRFMRRCGKCELGNPRRAPWQSSLGRCRRPPLVFSVGPCAIRFDNPPRPRRKGDAGVPVGHARRPVLATEEIDSVPFSFLSLSPCTSKLNVRRSTLHVHSRFVCVQGAALILCDHQPAILSS